MAKIVAGKVTFAKTVQDHQYEPRRAEVELAFAVGEGEDVEDAVREVGAQARAQALALVGDGAAGGRSRARSERARRFRRRTDADDD